MMQNFNDLKINYLNFKIFSKRHRTWHSEQLPSRGRDECLNMDDNRFRWIVFVKDRLSLFRAEDYRDVHAQYGDDEQQTAIDEQCQHLMRRQSGDCVAQSGECGEFAIEFGLFSDSCHIVQTENA